MKDKKEEFVNLIENNIDSLVNKYKLSESIHTDSYFEYGLRIGLDSLEQYLKKHYTFRKKPSSIRRRKWKPKMKRTRMKSLGKK